MRLSSLRRSAVAALALLLPLLALALVAVDAVRDACAEDEDCAETARPRVTPERGRR